MLITFSGLDGSGKSTLIHAVRAALEARGADVVVCHMTYDVGAFALLIRARDLVRRRAGRTVGPRKLAVDPGRLDTRWKRLRHAVVWNKTLRRAVYLVDLMIFTVYRLLVERPQGRILIMDRYFYDTLVDVSGPGTWGWSRVLARLTPTPDLALLLDTGPDEAYARKGEYSVEYLTRRWTAYQRVFGWVRSAVRLDNRDLRGATEEVVGRVEQHGLPIAVAV